MDWPAILWIDLPGVELSGGLHMTGDEGGHLLANFRVVYICHKVVALVGVVYQIIEKIFIVNISTAFFPAVCFRTNRGYLHVCVRTARPIWLSLICIKTESGHALASPRTRRRKELPAKQSRSGNACAIQKRNREIWPTHHFFPGVSAFKNAGPQIISGIWVQLSWQDRLYSLFLVQKCDPWSEV